MEYGITLSLEVAVCPSPTEATRQGYFYRPPVYTALKIEKAVVVREGTISGQDTVDLILVDENGKKFVTMITANLLKSIPI